MRYTFWEDHVGNRRNGVRVFITIQLRGRDV